MKKKTKTVKMITQKGKKHDDLCVKACNPKLFALNLNEVMHALKICVNFLGPFYHVPDIKIIVQ